MTIVLKKGPEFIFYQQKSRAKQYQLIFGFLLKLPYSNTTTPTLMLFQRLFFAFQPKIKTKRGPRLQCTIPTHAYTRRKSQENHWLHPKFW